VGEGRYEAGRKLYEGKRPFRRLVWWKERSLGPVWRRAKAIDAQIEQFEKLDQVQKVRIVKRLSSGTDIYNTSPTV